MVRKKHRNRLAKPRTMASRITNGPSRNALVFTTAWGWMGVTESATGITAIVISKGSRTAAAAALRETGKEPIKETLSSQRLRAAKQQLSEYVAGTRKSFDLPLDLSQGTVFQQRVWKMLQTVPYGQLRSYRQLASSVGGRRYARAVGGAVGANPLPIVVPCHRIVAQDGSLGGFSCGLPAKRRLLALEGSLSRIRRGDGNP